MLGLGKLFRRPTEQPAPAEPERIGLQAAKDVYRDLASKRGEEGKQEYERLKPQIEQAIKGVREAFEALKGKSVPEPRAVSSQKIKDAFADRMLGIIRNTQVPERPEAAARMMRRFMEQVRVGPREAAHLKFFFEAELAVVAGRLKEAAGLAAKLEQLSSSAGEDPAQRLDRLDAEAGSLKEELRAKRREVEDLDAKAGSLRGKERPDDSQERDRLAKLAQEGRRIESELEMAFKPVLRAVAEVAEGVADKRRRLLMQSFSSQPIDTFISDDSLLEVLREAGDDRLKPLLGRQEALRALRVRLGGVRREKAELEAEAARKRDARAAVESELAFIERRRAEAQKDASGLERRIEETEADQKEGVNALEAELRRLGKDVLIARN